MKRSLIVYFLFCLPCVAHAQTDLLIGTVVDSKTGEPLRDVQVYWGGYLGKRTYTNKFGVYQIEKQKNTNLLIFQLSGKGVVLKEVAEDQTELNVELKDLGASGATASRWEQTVYETPASVVIINREEIARHGYITLQEVLESVPGLFTTDHRSESDVSIGMRGAWSSHNRSLMIQVNGVSMLSERQNDFALNKINVPVEAIDRIEIVRGPMSLVYGAGAFLGVINIITNEANEQFNGFASLAVGTQAGSRSFLRYALNREGLQVALNASAYQRDGFEEEWGDLISNYGSNPINTMDFPEAVLLETYQNDQINPERYSREHQFINLSLAHEGFSANLNYATSNYGFSLIRPGTDLRNDYLSRTINAQFGYRGRSRKSKSPVEYEARFAVMNSAVDAPNRPWLKESFPIGEDQVSSIRSEVNARAVIFDTNKGDSLDLDFTGGLSFSQNLVNHSSYSIPHLNRSNWFVGLAEDESIDTWGDYVEMDLKMEKLQLMAGARLEQQGDYPILNEYTQEQNGSEHPVNIDDEVPANSVNFMPRVALIYKTVNSDERIYQYFKGVYATAFRQATAVDNALYVMTNAFDPATNDFTSERTYLNPERIATLELSYTAFFEELDAEVNLSLFRNNLRNLMIPKVDDNDHIAIITNEGALVTTGVELIARRRWKFSTALLKSVVLDTRFDATYQNTERKDALTSGEPPSFSPRWLGNLNVSAALGKVSFGMHINYVGSMMSDLLVPALEVGQVEPISKEAIEGYMRFGFNLRFDGIKLCAVCNDDPGRVFLSFRGSNLLNTLYRYPVHALNPWADRGMPGRRRQLQMTVGYKF